MAARSSYWPSAFALLAPVSGSVRKQ